MSGHIITRGLSGRTLITRGYGVSSFTAIIIREVLRLYSYIRDQLDLNSEVEWR